MKHTLTGSGLIAGACVLALSSATTQAATPLEGQLIQGVTFDCRGSVNYVVAPNSNTPAFVGHIQTIVDLPASAGGGSWVMSGVVSIGSDRGDNANVKQHNAPIARCFGQGDLRVGSCSTFSGVTSCQMQLDASNFRVTIDRGSKGLFSMDAGTTELFSTSSMGTEFIAFGTETSL